MKVESAFDRHTMHVASCATVYAHSEKTWYIVCAISTQSKSFAFAYPLHYAADIILPGMARAPTP